MQESPLQQSEKIMPQNIQQISVAQAPQLLTPRVTVSNMMDYSSRVMSEALQNPSKNICHSQPKPTGNNQSCHSSHYNPKKAIKLSPTLPASEQGAHLQMHRLWPSGPPERQQPCAPRFFLCFCNYSAKITDGLGNSSLHPASHAALGTATSGGQGTSQPRCWEQKQAPNSQLSFFRVWGSHTISSLTANKPPAVWISEMPGDTAA